MKKETRATLENLMLVFQKNAGTYQAERMKAYMRNLFDFYGLQKDKRAELASPFLKELMSSPEIAIHKIYRYEKQRECCLQKAKSKGLLHFL
jgi:hypothetical protein